MSKHLLSISLAAVVSLTGPQAGLAQDRSGESDQVSKADAYYHFALGHLYSELATAYGNKGQFVDKAIDNYLQAMKVDSDSAFVSEQLAELYIRTGRIREAVLEFEAAVSKNPDDLNARRILARIYTEQIGDTQRGRVSEEMLGKALEQYQKIAELDSSDPEAWVMLGRLHKLSTDSIAAEEAYKRALEVDADNEEALVGLAMVYFDLGDHTKTVEVLQRVVSNNPSARTFAFLAKAYENMGEPALAAETYRKALEVQPRNTQIKKAYAQSLLQINDLAGAARVFEDLVKENERDAESYLRLSQIYRQQGELPKARSALDSALELAPGDLEVQFTNVSLLEVEGKTDEAISSLKEILEATERTSYSPGERSNRVLFLEQLSSIYRSANRVEEAIEVYREIEKLDPDSKARIAAQVADTYRQAKDFDRALELIEEARREFPDSDSVGATRATILADMGKADEAAAAIQQVTGDRDDRTAYLTQAQIYEKTKRWDLMEEALDKALELSESEEEKATVLFMRGAMFERQKRFDQAEQAFRKVLQINPNNASAMNYLGYMFADRNTNLEEARKLITKALEYEPANGAYLDSLGWLYYRLNRFEEAESYLRQAVAHVANDPVVHDHLGDVYFQLGKLREAIDHWRISLQEWETASAAEMDPSQIAEIKDKLEGAEIRLAESTSSPSSGRP